VGFKNIEQISEYSLTDNLAYLRRLKKDFPTKIIVASIMGQNEAEWTQLAEMMTDVGADIIECNFSCPHMAANGLGSDVGQNPELVAAYTRATRRGTALPILAKMTPNIGNMELPAIAAVEAGATGIAAINTIKSIMNVNLDTFSSGPDVRGKTSVGGYSGKAVKPIALRFIHAMKSHPALWDVPISGMGGIETWRDAAEFMALGCENIQVTTSVMQYGYRVIDDMLEGMALYLGSHGYSCVSDIVGRALENIVPAEALDRKSICFPRFDKSRCLGCGRCTLSCYDGGHQALIQEPSSGKPILDASRCVGCHLCLSVCPVAAVTPGTRVSKEKLKNRAG
jgi:dihydropyrimidine dehydrogenase (NAD+) subunit PreA